MTLGLAWLNNLAICGQSRPDLAGLTFTSLAGMGCVRMVGCAGQAAGCSLAAIFAAGRPAGVCGLCGPQVGEQLRSQATALSGCCRLDSKRKAEPIGVQSSEAAGRQAGCRRTVKLCLGGRMVRCRPGSGQSNHIITF